MATFWETHESTENITDGNELVDVQSGIESSLRDLFWSDFESWSELDKSIITDSIKNYHPEATSVELIWNWIILWNDEKSISINVIELLLNWNPDAVEEITYDEVTARYQESISRFEESIVELGVLSDNINAVLESNNDEFWENIWPEDVIREWPFVWKTIIEAIFLYRAKIIQWADELRNLWYVNVEQYPTIEESRERLFDAQEEYLLLSMGIGEKREELCHVLPKTMSESHELISQAILRRSPREILDWMRDIHKQIDNNNWQDGTVEQNYKYFSDTLNILALEKIKADIYYNESSENYRKPDLFLEFAVFASGRPSWDEESRLFRNDIWEYASPVDSRLWDPLIAEEALVYAMDIEKENGISMISAMSDHMEIHDEALRWSPAETINTALTILRENVFIEQADWEKQTLWESASFDAVLEALWYAEIIEKSQNWALSEEYAELSLEEMIQVSSLARLEISFREYERVSWYSARVSWHKSISIDELEEVALQSNEDAVTHVWSELDRNFDDGFWEKFWEVMIGFWAFHESEEERSQQFWIDPNSIEHQIFTLYNDINWNGNFGEVSDTTRETYKTAGYILAMVVGSVALWWAVGAWLRLASIAVWNVSTGALMGTSWSALWYSMDSLIWDARGFYSPIEAITWIWSDFIVWAGTGAFWGVLVNRFWTQGPSLRNKWIFAGDLAVLGFWAEWGRILAHNSYWHGNDIFTPITSENTIDNYLLDIQRQYFRWELNEEQTEEYFSTNPDYDILPLHFSEYRFMYQLFPHMWIEDLNIDREFDSRFMRAHAIYTLLTPWSYFQIYHSEPEFEWIMRLDETWIDGVHERLLEAIETWIVRQERRLSEISI